MASKKSVFHRRAEVDRCQRLIDHYHRQGWPRRAARVRIHIYRLLLVDNPALGSLASKRA